MDRPEIIILPSMFAMIGYICWLWAGTVQRRRRLMAISALNTKLLERLGTVKDFGEFMHTKAGARLLSDLAWEPARVGPQDRILRAAQTGVVMPCLAVGLLLLSFFSPLASDDAWAGVQCHRCDCAVTRRRLHHVLHDYRPPVPQAGAAEPAA